eukprot:scaffold236634_cov18-Tisochrysis_lutea.AAC.1
MPFYFKEPVQACHNAKLRPSGSHKYNHKTLRSALTLIKGRPSAQKFASVYFLTAIKRDVLQAKRAMMDLCTMKDCLLPLLAVKFTDCSTKLSIKQSISCCTPAAVLLSSKFNVLQGLQMIAMVHP